MEKQDETETKNEKNEWQQWYGRHHSPLGRILGGFVLLGIGALLLMEKMGYFFPSWVFTWKMLLIALGIFVGARHLFHGLGWLIPIMIGLLFLADDLIPGFQIRPFIWPIVIVIIGLIMIFRPKRRYYGPHSWHSKWRHKNHRFYRGYNWQQVNEEDSSDDDRLEAVVVFGSTKKNIISKDFKGGEVVCVFGGAEINLSQADINGKVVLEFVQVFGGTTLIVPPHWQVNYQETVAFLGGIEDKRTDNKNTEPNKILVLKGTSVFGAIDIKSY